MAEKIINTRIINKNADFDQWMGLGEYAAAGASTLALKKGEIALARFDAATTDPLSGEIKHVPAYAIKVGTGEDGKETFKDSAWLYAPASDVHAWAKKNELAYEDLPETLRTEIDALQEAIGTEGSVAEMISAAIAELDSVSDGEGSFVKAVTQADGKVSVTYGKIEISDVEGLTDKFAEYRTAADQDLIDAAQDEAIAAVAEDLAEYVSSNDTRVKALEDNRVTEEELADAIKDFETKENVKKVADDLAAYEQSNDAALAEVKATADDAAVKADVDAAFEAVAKDITDAKAAVIGTEGDLASADTVYGAKKYAKDLVDAIPAQTDYTVTCADQEFEATEDAPAFKRHTLTQNGATVCTIDVPRDLVVKSGYVDGETDELVLVLINDEEVRVDVSHLIEYVTGGTAEDGMITVTVSDDFVATATINDGTITSDKFAAEAKMYISSTASSAFTQGITPYATRLVAVEEQSAETKEGLAQELIDRAAADEALDGKITALSGTVSDNKGAYDAYVLANDARVKAVEDDIAALDATYATNDELSSAVETINGEIAKKLDESTYTAYIAGKALSDDELKAYADDKAAAAKTAAEATAAGALDAYAETTDAAIKTINDNYVRVSGSNLVFGQGEEELTIIFDCGGIA